MTDETPGTGPGTPERGPRIPGNGPPGSPGPIEAEGEEDSGIVGKLVLTLFPFVLVLLFLLIEWWIRGRS